MKDKLARLTKKGWYGIDLETFNKIAERGDNTMVSIKSKRYRLEAIEKAYDSVANELNSTLAMWDIEKDELRYRTIEELDEDEQIKYRAYQDFLKELEKLA